jgi:inosine-uridine nucleoside N-ribohydrolase
LKKIIFLFFFLSSFFAISQKKEEKLQIIIDADTANEIDDLFAITRAIGEPRLELLGITASQFHTSPYASKNTAMESLEMNKTLIDLIPKYNVPIFLGSPLPLKNNKNPQISKASRFIINQAKILPKGKKTTFSNIGLLHECSFSFVRGP